MGNLWGDQPDKADRPKWLKGDEGPTDVDAAIHTDQGWEVPLDGTNPEDGFREVIAAMSNPPGPPGTAGNEAPDFIYPQAGAVLAAFSGVPFQVVVQATDVEDDALTLVRVDAVAWLSYVDNGNGTATYSGTPAAPLPKPVPPPPYLPGADVGTHTLNVTADDGVNAPVPLSFQVVVTDP